MTIETTSPVCRDCEDTLPLDSHGWCAHCAHDHETVCNACGKALLDCDADKHGRCKDCSDREAPCPDWKCSECGRRVENEHEIDACDICHGDVCEGCGKSFRTPGRGYPRSCASCEEEGARDDYYDAKYRASIGD